MANGGATSRGAHCLLDRRMTDSYSVQLMRYAIISDMHSNLPATRAVFDDIDRNRPDAIVCLGDLTGYGASPNEVVDMVREREVPCVMGNHDAAACGKEEPWFFRSAAKRAIEWHGQAIRADNRAWLATLPEQIQFGEYCLAVHGSPGNRDDYIIDWLDAVRAMEHLDDQQRRVCFYGHSHRVALFNTNGLTVEKPKNQQYKVDSRSRFLINPGAVGQPRDGDVRAAYAIYDADAQEVEFRRVEYDIGKAQHDILEAGLPPALASRLEKGK